nr:hypothetical protein [Candidatus Avimonas sp.]
MARGQTVYRHPPTHPADMIVETPEKRFVSDEQMQEWNKLRQETPNMVNNAVGIKDKIVTGVIL